MEQTLRAFYCPCCGARLEPPRQRVVACEYCDARLQAEPESIVEDVSGETPTEFPSELRQARHGRFEMSWLRQRVVDQELDVLHFSELGDGVGALVYLRRCDGKGVSQPGALPLEPILESLGAYRDPGLAAHRGLEWLCEQPQGFSHHLECCICVLDSGRSVAQIYTAGTPRSLYWVSNELASVSDVGGYQPALERKMLLEARDHFSGQPDCALAAYDALVFVSAAYAGRGDGPYADGSGALSQELQNQLGEDPLRLVTLAKNAFWQKRAPAARDAVPGNSLHVVAVQARPSEAAADFRMPALELLSSRKFETAAWNGPEDFYELLPLHGDRNVVVWASNDGLPWSNEARGALREALLAVLDRKDHGDNENPREAGRRALEKVAMTRLAVIQLLDCYGRVKYFRSGMPHPIYLAPRGHGQNASSIMAYDEGGEVTLDKGSRLLFLGRQLGAQALNLPSLAEHWPGGKASNLYWTLCKLWTTPPAAAALQKVLKAIAGDGNLGAEAGYLLVGAR
jgi:hypothetical protein